MIIRLNKYLSECGIASRRKSDILIQEGRISINGKVISELGFKVNPDIDEISIDGEIIKSKEKLYYLLNKPKGVISSTKDERKRRVVTDLIPINEKIYPVGRLDFNTTGVLLLTNDGEFSNFLTHPKNGIEREYEVLLDKELKIEDKKKLLKGVYLERRKSLFQKIYFPKKNIYNLVRVITVEGRNHFVKNMFNSLDYDVKELHRVRYGIFNVGKLKKGEMRVISQKELNKIKRSKS